MCERKKESTLQCDGTNKIHEIFLTPAYKALFLSILLGLIIHGYAIVNNVYTGSDTFLFSPDGWNWALAQGRWFQPVIDMISGLYAMPYVTRLISVIYYALAVVGIITLYKIKHLSVIVLVSGIVLSMPYMSTAFLYTTLSDSFAFGCLLAVLSVLVTERWRFGCIAGAILLCLSLALYQAFVGIASGLCGAYLFIEYTKIEKKHSFFEMAIRFFILGVGALILYLTSLKISAYFVPLAARQGIDDIGNMALPNMAEIIKSLVLPILWPPFYGALDINGFTSFQGSIISIVISFTVIIVVFAVFFTQLIFLIKHKHQEKNLKIWVAFVSIALWSLFLMIFLMMCGVILLLKAEIYHGLMYWGMMCVPILTVIIAKSMPDIPFTRVLFKITAIVFIAFILNNSISINDAYFRQEISYKGGMQFASMLQADIYKTDGYERDKTIILFGSAIYRQNPVRVPGIPFLSESHAGSQWVTADLLPNLITFYGWLPNKAIRGDQRWKYFLSEENRGFVSDAPIYPLEGSIIVFDDYIAVRLSDKFQ